ncbi:Plasmodium exported protein (PHIST), unknown function [Plasmodium vivax]|uniref:Plasmodium RESA N-terminal domain-containing protein n=1 Tax=Plasmodium vivax TaxID=5855 RepID=A0A1G4HEI8_PLAVI|nr:Plasmodium exported protein (PHIST), unknown function [Plasmodium vivax]
MKNCSARTVIFPVNHASTNKKNGSQNYFANPLRGVGERSSKKSSGNLTLLKPMHILLIALLSLLLQGEDASVLGSEDASVYGSKDSILFGSEDASVLGSEDASVLGSDDASVLGSEDASVYGSKDSILFGGEDASVLGSEDASVYGSKDSILFGSEDASVLGSDDASVLGSEDASVLGSKAPSVYGSKAPSVYGSKAPSVSGSKAPSVSGSKAPSVSGSKAASVYGSKAASVYGSKAASVYGSKASIVYGSKASSVYGKDDESIMGDQYSSSNSINMDDSTVTLIKNKNPKASAYGAQKGNSNIKNDHENDSASEIMSTIGSESISEESINQDNSADSKNEEQITGKIISDLVNSLGETVKISEMTHIFNLMMALERKKYDNLENDIILYADEAAKKQTATERYKTLEWIRVQYSLMGSVINFEKNAYKTLRYLIKSETQSRAEFINLIKCARNSWNSLRKDKEYMAKEHIAKSMKKFNKKKKYYVYS